MKGDRNSFLRKNYYKLFQEKYPKAQIDVYITVIEDGGSVLATCLTAASLALCHASIDVYDIVIGSSVVRHLHL